MARSKVAQVSEFPYHITARTPNRVRFPIPLGLVWEIFEEDLYYAHIKYKFEILSFVLMPNHFHLLARTPEIPLGKILNDLMRDASKRINFESGRINQNWGETAYRCEIRDTNYFYNVYRYVYQNPLRASLCERAEDYTYSTLHGLLGSRQLLIPVQEDTLLFDTNIENHLKWLNTLQNKKDVEAIRMGLKYREFRIKKGGHNNTLLLHPDMPHTSK